MDLKFRTKAACRIAMIDPQRFNEDVSAGEYPCAPKTKSGVSRVFDEKDIAGLLVYGHLMRVYEPARYVKKIAAMYACGIVNALRNGTTTDESRVDFPLDGFNDIGVNCNKDDSPYFANDTCRALAATMSFDLNSIMEIVRKRAADSDQS